MMNKFYKSCLLLILLLNFFSFKSFSQTVQFGIRYASPDSLEIRATPSVSFSGSANNLTFAFRTEIATTLNISPASGYIQGFQANPANPIVSGKYKYYVFGSTGSSSALTFTSGSSTSIIKIKINNFDQLPASGYFELIKDEITLNNGGDPSLDIIGERINPTTPFTADFIATYGGSSGPAPLPVTLTSFSTSLQNKNNVLLKWATASETNNEKFIVERSGDGKTFERISEVKGHGSTNMAQNYTTTDHNPLSGISYYRLKQMDFDGKFEYSKIVSIKNNGTGPSNFTISSVQPNPFSSKATVDFNLTSAGTVKLTLSDMVGRELQTKSVEGRVGANEVTFEDLNRLSKGVYVVTLQDGSKSTTYKLMKK